MSYFEVLAGSLLYQQLRGNCPQTLLVMCLIEILSTVIHLYY